MDCINSAGGKDAMRAGMSDCRMRRNVQVLGMAYVPWQKWDDIYKPEKALCCGTLFAVLDKPFKGGCK